MQVKKLLRKLSCFGNVDTSDSDIHEAHNLEAHHSVVSVTTHSSVMGLPKVDLPAPPNPDEDPVGFLYSLPAIRQQCNRVGAKALKNELIHFSVDLECFDETVSYVAQVVRRDHGSDFASIPPHGRWQHFEIGDVPRIDMMMQTWSPVIDSLERTRRLIDLTTVSVLLDAGAGNVWKYRPQDSSRTYSRSEGIAVASFEMFGKGMFSSSPDNAYQVDGECLRRLDSNRLADGMQVTPANPIDGFQGRADILVGLGNALLSNPTYFSHNARPGSMIDYLLAHPSTFKHGDKTIILVPTLWELLTQGFARVWPEGRLTMMETNLGDTWKYNGFITENDDKVHNAQTWETVIPFHKLTQWLCYSLMIPMRRYLNVEFAGEELLTGLPEYRNGGLLLDFGTLKIKPAEVARGISKYDELFPNVSDRPEVLPYYRATDDLIVEWRAATVFFLDKLLTEVNSRLGNPGLTLAQLLEAGTWKAGREVAALCRPQTGAPPIQILSDGTVF